AAAQPLLDGIVSNIETAILVGSRGIAARGAGAIEAAIELPDYLVIGIEQRAAAAPGLGDAAVPAHGPEARIAAYETAKTDALIRAVWMMDTREGFRSGRCIGSPGQMKGSRRSRLAQTQEGEIAQRRTGQKFRPAARACRAGQVRRRSITSARLEKPKELRARGDRLAPQT